MDEFALIEVVLAELGEQTHGAAIAVGPGDDGAVIEPVAGQHLVSSIDTLVADVHFPAAADPALVGYRALAISVSDLAAMGADPLYCLVAVTLPDEAADWLRGFARGVAAASFAFRCPVAGGNLARGPHNVSVSVHGQVPPGGALVRSGARPGDRVLVSGRLGAAAVALASGALREPQFFHDVRRQVAADREHAIGRYFMPTPRLDLGRALRGIASAAIDVSDGLLADLEHVCRASRCGASIDVAKLPRVQAATIEQALTGGDDYELCLTVPAHALRQAQAIAAAVEVPLTEIGTIEAGGGITLTRSGAPYAADHGQSGFRHFR